MALEAVLFDLDGTLIDTAPDMIAAANRLRFTAGHPPLDESELRPEVSNGSKALVQMALEISEKHPEFAKFRQDFLDYYGQDLSTHGTKLFEGFEIVLGEIEQLDIPWGIVTNKPRTYAEPLLEQLNLSKRCAVLVCPDDVTNTKPDPEPIYLACRKIGSDPGRTIYVGDHQRDITSGINAGCPTVGVSFGYIDSPEIAHTWGADYIIDKPIDLLAVVDNYL